MFSNYIANYKWFIKLHFTALNWRNKILENVTYAIHCMKQKENMKT